MKEVTLSKIIGENGVFVDGDWVESKDQDTNGDVRLIQLADIGDGVFINKSKRFLTSGKVKELRCTILKKGDLLIARMPDPLGRACIFPSLDMPCVTVVDICIVRPDANIANSIWLKFLINSYDFRNKINKYITGTTRQRISRGNLEKLSFELPPLSDQLYIANILSTAENLVAQRKESIRLLDEFLKNMYMEMFFGGEFDKVKLGSILEIQCGQVNPNEHPYSEMYHVGGVNIASNSGKIINLKLAKDEFLISGKYLFTENHILYSKIRPYLNKVAIPNFMGICSADIYPLLPNGTKLDKNYLRYALMSSDFINYTAKHSDRTNIPKINRKALINYDISLPKLQLQRQFAAIVEKTEALKTQYQQSLLELENLYGSLSQRAFNWNLSVSEYQAINI